MSKVLISVLSGLGGMFGWGVSDFLANTASDKMGHTKTLFWSQLAGLMLMLSAVVLLRPVFDTSFMLFSILAFAVVGYTTGYLYFYKAFEVGNVSVASIIINLNAVFTMLISYFFFGQRLQGLQIPAVILILVGIMLVSVDFHDLFKTKQVALLAGAKESFIASIGFGVVFWPLMEYVVDRSNWLWAALMVKCLNLIFILLLTLYQRKSLVLKTAEKALGKILISIGLLETLAVLSVNYGISIGDQILIAPIANSVALVTVTLAVIFLKEKLSQVQVVGMAATIAGIVMTAL